ncbi:ABC transporter permease [Rhodococcus sp. 05-2254-6]|uniref:ABC transporter permease n=1 Tax=Rhodococcus sp. 05-2254-6 TaxID=2022489 RepID=UPI000B9B1BA2|nr:ABC transporter permease [Rhodococcus sp. 05-2254-6]OZE24347.1 ABC transporter permease [Rhodococcus sp. 05-2254-6]
MDRRTAIAGVALAALTVYAVAVPMLAGVDDRVVDFSSARLGPSAQHPFGTDSAGRDLFVRSASAVGTSLLIAVACAALATILGCVVGLAAGVWGGRVDRIVMRSTDAVNALPHLLLGIVIVAMFRGSVVAIVASIALTHWTQVARIVRSEILRLREREFVDAAILAGASRFHVATRHFVPAVLPQAMIAVVLLLPHAVWHESTLSFLGFGLPPHEPSLGTLLEEARSSLLLGSWWTLVFPAAILLVATLSVAVLGSAMRARVTLVRPSELRL